MPGFEIDTGRPSVTAHAGAMLTLPNKPYSVRKSVRAGADIVEIDVTFRPDGTPVMKHASSPGKRGGAMLYKGFAEVAKSGTCRINLDLKSSANLPEVERLAREYGLSERVFFTGVGEEWAVKARAETDIPYYLNVVVDERRRDDPGYARELAEKIMSLGAIGLNCEYTGISKTLVDTMRENGLLVSAWTVNGRGDMQAMLDAGVDNITTRRPAALMRMMAQG